MQAIICNILAKTTIGELSAFVHSGIKPIIPFTHTPEILKYEILDISDPVLHEGEFHGLISFGSVEDMETAIERLDGQKLYGRPVKVREYHHRTRADHRVDKDHQGFNRPEDRRREGLVVQKRSEEATVSGYDLAQAHRSKRVN